MADDKRDKAVSWGCGTLILIALIVLIFSGRDDPTIRNEIQNLSAEVQQLRNEVREQMDILKNIQARQPPSPE